MDGLDFPSAIHNMDDIRIKSLSEVSLDAFEGRLSFEKSKINYGLITKVLEELEWTSEVIIGCLGDASEDIRCRIRGQRIDFMEAFSDVPGSITSFFAHAAGSRRRDLLKSDFEDHRRAIRFLSDIRINRGS